MIHEKEKRKTNIILKNSSNHEGREQEKKKGIKKKNKNEQKTINKMAKTTCPSITTLMQV